MTNCKISMAIALLLLMACSNDETDLNLPDEYSYQIALSCFCGQGYLGPHFLRIKENQIIEYQYLGASGQSFDPDTTTLRTFTIEHIANRITEIQNSDDGTVSDLEFHSQFNFPTKGYMDPITLAIDDELGFEITDFQEL